MITRFSIETHFGLPMPRPKLVNLDALIQRADLLVPNPAPPAQISQSQDSIYLNMLRLDEPYFNALRKPDFQRETSSWAPEQIVRLVANHLNDELIPAVILWRDPVNHIFVIDGAHRLSAFIAWVNDDYGFGDISQRFFGAKNISDGQRDAHEVTKKLIDDSIGSYKELTDLLKSKEWKKKEQEKQANAIGTLAIKTQTLTSTSAKAAEQSFVRINQGGVRISPTEAAIIRKREKPEGIAARAMLRAGSGYPYWSKCKPADQEKIVSLAKEIDVLLYEPELDEEDIYSAIPMAGKRYTGDALGFLFHLIQVTNGLLPTRAKSSAIKKEKPLRKKELGDTTVRYLGRIRDILLTMFSKANHSLGLHPAVYCRSATGRFQPAAFYAQIQFVQHLETEHDGFHKFTAVREKFEDFLVNHKAIINEIVRGKGASTRSLKTISEIYVLLYENLKQGKTPEEIKGVIFNDNKFRKYLSQAAQVVGTGDFSSEAKAAIKMRSELDNAARCRECGARMHMVAVHGAHIIAREDDGPNHSDNGTPKHPFCNTGVEERRRSNEKKASKSEQFPSDPL
jgi:hypothetical protein